MDFPYLTTLVSYINNHDKRRLLKKCFGLRNKTGIEVGGPSRFFRLRGYFPIYGLAKKIDGVNFSAQTVWEGKLEEGKNYNYYKNKNGFQFISEASDLSQIKNNSYDFLLSCHSLEHVANVIKTLNEWNRVLKPGGSFILVLPDKRYIFDHNRPYTTFEHLLKDFENNVDEHDTAAFEELSKLHDVSMDPGVKSKEEFIERLQKNYLNRCAHHHVFNNDLINQMLEYCNYNVIEQKEIQQFHLFTLATKK